MKDLIEGIHHYSSLNWGGSLKMASFILYQIYVTMKTMGNHRCNGGKIKSKQCVDTCGDGLTKNQVGANKNKKKHLLQQLDILDRKAKTALSSPQELENKHVLSAELSGSASRGWTVLVSEIKKTTRLLQEDDNTNIFKLWPMGNTAKLRFSSFNGMYNSHVRNAWPYHLVGILKAYNLIGSMEQELECVRLGEIALKDRNMKVRLELYA